VAYRRVGETATRLKSFSPSGLKSPRRCIAHSPTRSVLLTPFLAPDQQPLTNHFSRRRGLRRLLAALGAMYTAGVVSR
jgi:hypothetical protein